MPTSYARRPRWPALLAALLLVALAGCGAAPAVTRQEQTVEGLTIALETAERPPINTNQTFTVTLSDAQGRPVDGAEVYLDLTMPAMPMGTNRPIADPQGQGRYSAGAAYTMTGVWEIAVVAEVAGAEHRAVFTLEAIE